MKGHRDMTVRDAAHEAIDRLSKDLRMEDISRPLSPDNIAWVFGFTKVFHEHLVDVLRECLDDKEE